MGKAIFALQPDYLRSVLPTISLQLDFMAVLNPRPTGVFL